MNFVINIDNLICKVDLDRGHDISIPLHPGIRQVNCFYAPLYQHEPVKMGNFIGSLESGSPVNFYNVKLNPHGNGTHTESSAHISSEGLSVNQVLTKYLFAAELLSVYPTRRENGDLVIEAATIAALWQNSGVKALIVRTLPNDDSKITRQYSGTNPPYFSPEAIDLIVENGIQHLLVDLPSVDKEEDQGLLASHKSFWKGDRSRHCTITELIYVKNEITDGFYLLNLQLAPIELDASPSRPVIYPLNLV
ncbi:MAG: cyclase family protein [Saprospiraceae bacterium]|jgi:arylformamidase|nr:cyclase family protein [Saprospiraceae bacterium]